MPDRDQPRAFHLTPAAWFAVAAIILLPWAIVLFLLLRPHDHEPSPSATVSVHVNQAPKNVVEPSRPGPWGDLHYNRIQIEPPEDIIRLPTPQPTRWNFPGYKEPDLEKLWAAADLTAAQRASLNRPERREVSAAGISLLPETSLILELSPATRAKIYAELAGFPQNPLHADPFRFRADAIDEWFADCGLPESVIQQIRKLIYIRANNAVFSDLEVILPLLSNPVDQVRLIKTLSRKTALIAELQLSKQTDTDSLARYWGQGRRSKDLGVLLDSIANRSAGGKLDIVHLLPPFARLLLYTFPTPTEDARAAARDCHWTSFNFYAAQPDDRFTDIDHVRRVLDQEYYPVGGVPAFGDIVLLIANGTQGVHSCIYVADDIVFTKNGSSFSVPWTLARLENVVAFYSFAEPVEVRRYRRKNS